MEWQKLLPLYYAAINLIAAAAFIADKHFAAARRRRVPERLLLFLAFIGGGAGAFFAMTVFRHKTRHLKFMLLGPLFIILHLALWRYLETGALW